MGCKERLCYKLAMNVEDDSFQVEVHEDYPEIRDTELRVYHNGGFSFRLLKEYDGVREVFVYSFRQGEDEFKPCGIDLAIRLFDEAKKEYQIEKIKNELVPCFKCPVCDSVTEGEDIEDLYNEGIRYKTMKHMEGVFCKSCYSDEEIQASSL